MPRARSLQAEAEIVLTMIHCEREGCGRYELYRSVAVIDKNENPELFARMLRLEAELTGITGEEEEGMGHGS